MLPNDKSIIQHLFVKRGRWLALSIIFSLLCHSVVLAAPTSQNADASVAADAPLTAAAIDTTTGLYSKYNYSRWSSPGGHYSVQISGCSFLCFSSVQNAQNVANHNLSDYATASISGSSLLSSIRKIARADLETTAQAGEYAGWLVPTGTVATLSIFGKSYLRTYLNGTLQEQRAINSLVDVGLIASFDGGQNIAFRTTKSFNRVEIEFDFGSLGLNLFNSFHFYYAFAAKMIDADGDNLPDLSDPDADNDGLLNQAEQCLITHRLNYEFYNGTPASSSAANIPTSGALAANSTDNFNVGSLQALFTPTDSDSYAIRYSGILRIDQTGRYTFFTSSDDGSLLYIDDVLVVNNDGVHGAQERSGAIDLTAGWHNLRIHFFEAYFDASLVVQYSGPAVGKQALPFSILSGCASNVDTDQDGVPNHLDWDSDNDAIPDRIESGIAN